MTLLNETDILGQYLEKEVRAEPHTFLWWGGGFCAPQEPN